MEGCKESAEAVQQLDCAGVGLQIAVSDIFQVIHLQTFIIITRHGFGTVQYTNCYV